ncbi:MAG TPA: signal recognition particle-docking protein FtsY [Verrucomicrobiae bacterium]
MGFFQRLKEGLKKTSDKLVHEIKRIVTGSPKLTASTVEELEAALLSADFGVPMTNQILAAVRKAYESQGGQGLDVSKIAAQEVEKSLGEGQREIKTQANGVTVIAVVGVNGTGKTTTTAKLAKRFHDEGHAVVMAACDTFRAAAIEQLKLWGTRLNAPVIAGAYNADPAAVAHDAVAAATSRNAKYLLVDTAGRLHTKNNLMKELQKVHRVIDKQLPGAPHEVLLVLDATTGMNALNQAKEFHKAVNLTGLVITKLDGTSKGGMVVAIQKELGIPVKFIGVGEQADDLQPFEPKEFAKALFGE